MDVLLQSMLPVASVAEETADGTSGAEHCPRVGGRIGRMMNLCCGRPRRGPPVLTWETSTDPGRGVGLSDQ